MKLFPLLLFAVAAIGNSNLAQEAGRLARGLNPVPNSEATLAYIHAAWETLTRSMTDCHSLVDIKVTSDPVLYLPAEMSAPPEVAALRRSVM